MMLRKQVFPLLILGISIASCSFIQQHEQATIPLQTQSTSTGKEWSCTKYHLPAVIEGCEGEGPCGELEHDRALHFVDIYNKPFFNDVVIDQLNQGEFIENPQPYFVINKFGKVIVTNPGKELAALGVKKGDILPLVQYYEESLEVCVGEHSIEAESLYENVPNAVKIIEENETEAWVQLKTPRGVTGYALDISEIPDYEDQWYRGKNS